MTDKLTKCTACNGRGYFNCDCWPGDCICGFGDETCEECGGDGFIDPNDEQGCYMPEHDEASPSPETRERGWHDISTAPTGKSIIICTWWKRNP